MYTSYKNIVLIGMPGCGKTTIGEELAKKLEIKFVDVDKFIEEKNHKTIPQLFEQGEECFRKLESEAIRELSREKGLVLSTGGGVIKNSINIDMLKTNGIIIFIDRPVEKIAGDVSIAERPLLKQGVNKLYELFSERYELYRKYCDFRIVNDGEIGEALEKILEVILSSNNGSTL